MEFDLCLLSFVLNQELFIVLIQVQLCCSGFIKVPNIRGMTTHAIELDYTVY